MANYNLTMLYWILSSTISGYVGVLLIYPAGSKIVKCTGDQLTFSILSNSTSDNCSVLVEFRKTGEVYEKRVYDSEKPANTSASNVVIMKQSNKKFDLIIPNVTVDYKGTFTFTEIVKNGRDTFKHVDVIIDCSITTTVAYVVRNDSYTGTNSTVETTTVLVNHTGDQATSTESNIIIIAAIVIVAVGIIIGSIILGVILYRKFGGRQKKVDQPEGGHLVRVQPEVVNQDVVNNEMRGILPCLLQVNPD